MAHIALRIRIANKLTRAKDSIAVHTGMARAEVFDTRDGSTIRITRLFIAHRMAMRGSFMDYDII